MKLKTVFLSLLTLASALTLAGCGGPTTLPDEPYEAIEYQLYPAPEGTLYWNNHIYVPRFLCP